MRNTFKKKKKIYRHSTMQSVTSTHHWHLVCIVLGVGHKRRWTELCKRRAKYKHRTIKSVKMLQFEYVELLTSSSKITLFEEVTCPLSNIYLVQLK